MGLLKIRRGNENRGVGPDANEVAIAPLPKEKMGISDAAAARIADFMQSDIQSQAYMRVAIRGGGCSGLSIHYEFCESTRPNDLIFEKNDVRVCIDPKSLGILGGATLHFRERLGVGEFVLVNNPSEKQCSCGKSFAL